MSTVATSEVLNRAADLIEERGWTKGSLGWRGNDGALCLEGALYAALGVAREDDGLRIYSDCPAYDAVVAYLDLNPTPKRCPISDSVWGWNDNRKSASEVIEVLRAVAVIEAARENATVEVRVSA